MTQDELKQGLAKVGLSPDVCDLIADQAETGKAALIFRDPLSGKNIGIANDDFPLLEKAAESIVIFIGATALIGWAPALIAHLVILGYQFRKKQFELTGFQLALVNELKANPDSTTGDLAMLVSKSAEDVAKELHGLTEIRRADGKRVAAVSQDSKGRWRVEDL